MTTDEHQRAVSIFYKMKMCYYMALAIKDYRDELKKVIEGTIIGCISAVLAMTASTRSCCATSAQRSRISARRPRSESFVPFCCGSARQRQIGALCSERQAARTAGAPPVQRCEQSIALLVALAAI